MVRLMETAAMNPENYSVDELMTDLKKGIFSELAYSAKIDIYRRNIQNCMWIK